MGFTDFISDALGSIGGAIVGGGGDATSTTDSGGGGGLFGAIGDMFTNSDNLGALITGGLGLWQGMENADMADAEAKLAADAQKFAALRDIAKLKYAGGGGGGGGAGSTRNKNADLIEVLKASRDDKRQTLDSIAKNYIAAVR